MIKPKRSGMAVRAGCRRCAEDGRQKGKKNMKNLEKRYQDAINKIGGAFAILSLPEAVKNILKSVTDLETKVKILEEIAKQKNKG